MKLKKVLSVVVATAMSLSMLVGCGKSTDDASTTAATEGNDTTTAATEDDTTAEATGEGVAVEDLKVGCIFIGDENEGYTEAHYEGVKAMMESLGLSEDQVIIEWKIPEGQECYDAAVDLAEQGCQIIFANSFGHEDFMLQAAADYPDIQFCHATGYRAASSGLSNMHNYFTSVYESRYVSGVVAGLKLNEMIENGDITEDEAKLGYVGAFAYAEVISGYTAFYLGVKSVCDSATMEVKYTQSWADQALEQETAKELINDGCVLISQHADTTGAPLACEDAGVPEVGYNIDMISVAPNSALTSASINWAPYYTYAVQCIIDGTAIDTDWCKGYEDDADKITALNENVCAEGTAEKVAEVEAALKDGSLKVFDTSTFTVNGMTMEEYVETEDGQALAQYVSDGYFHESELASAPSFSVVIDGITEE